MLVRNCFLLHITVYEEERFRDKIYKATMENYSFVHSSHCMNAICSSLHESVIGHKVMFYSLYIEPDNSPYFNRNVYDELQKVLLLLNCDHVCLLGDF